MAVDSVSGNVASISMQSKNMAVSLEIHENVDLELDDDEENETNSKKGELSSDQAKTRKILKENIAEFFVSF